VTVEISIERNLSDEELNNRGVYQWSIWEKEVSELPWAYDAEEVCYLLQGEITVTPDGGKPVTIKAGDFVTFPAGMSCYWKISSAIKKHFNFN